MNNDLIKINYRQERIGIRTYKIKFIAEIMHTGLNDYKVLTSDNYVILQNKVDAHIARLEEKWDKKYPIVISSWKNNWHKLSTFFKYAKPIRKLIYTTNAIEGFHRQVRKITKNKTAFTSDMALLKQIYLAQRNISKKWTQPLQNWGLTVSQLSIIFGERLKLKILE